MSLDHLFHPAASPDATYRGVKVVGPLGPERGEEVRSKVNEIATSWVADDIVLDLREASEIDSRALTSLTSAGAAARDLGHRLVVRAAAPARELLMGSAGAFVVTD